MRFCHSWSQKFDLVQLISTFVLIVSLFRYIFLSQGDLPILSSIITFATAFHSHWNVSHISPIFVQTWFLFISYLFANYVLCSFTEIHWIRAKLQRNSIAAGFNDGSAYISSKRISSLLTIIQKRSENLLWRWRISILELVSLLIPHFLVTLKRVSELPSSGERVETVDGSWTRTSYSHRPEKWPKMDFHLWLEAHLYAGGAQWNFEHFITLWWIQYVAQVLEDALKSIERLVWYNRNGSLFTSNPCQFKLHSKLCWLCMASALRILRPREMI